MMSFRINKTLIGGLDKKLFIYTAFLSLTGLLVLYSATRPSGTTGPASAWQKQVLWTGITGIVMVVSVAIPYAEWRRYAYFAYFGALGTLAIMPYISTSLEAHGSVRWIRIGPIWMQPSEFTKACLILALARALDLPKEKKGTFALCLIALGMASLPVILVLRQPDLGTALCLLAPTLAMLFVAGARLRHLALFACAGACAAPLGYFFVLKPYQRSRIMTFLSPDSDPLGTGWNILQSKIAIGSGEIWGKGWLANTQGQLRFLPRHHTDFIFSVLAEEQGFVGTVIVLLVFWLWVTRTLKIAKDAKDRFGRILVVGVATLFAFQVLVNASMTMGLLPCTGIPMPMFSYGGSNLLIMMWGMGMVQNVYIRRFMFP